MSETVNPMAMPQITKVVVNIGVGEGGDRLSNAEKVLELVTGVTPVRTLGKQQNRDLKYVSVSRLVAKQQSETLNLSRSS